MYWDKFINLIKGVRKLRQREQIYLIMFDYFINTCVNNVPIFKHLDNTVHSADYTRTLSHDPFPCVFKRMVLFGCCLGKLFLFNSLHPKFWLMHNLKTKRMVLVQNLFCLVFCSLPTFYLMMSEEIIRSLFLLPGYAANSLRKKKESHEK